MKVLLTNKDNNTLIVSKILEFEYFREEKEISIAGEVDDFIIHDVEEEKFNELAKQLFIKGMADLSRYKAEIVE